MTEIEDRLNKKQISLISRLSSIEREMRRGVGEVAKSSRGSTHYQDTNIGDFVEFDPHDQTAYPKVGGIYVLYDISERPLYVGQGRAIDKRIRNHNDKFWFKSPIVESASYVRIEDQLLREQFESVLIKFLKRNAIINKQMVDR